VEDGVAIEGSDPPTALTAPAIESPCTGTLLCDLALTFCQSGLSDESLSLETVAKHLKELWSERYSSSQRHQQEVGRWVQNIGGPYFTAFYRTEVSMDIQNKLTRSVAVTAGIAAAGLAVGAAAMGAFAIGALAIGALALRKVAIRGGRVERLSVGQLTVDRLLVKDSVNRE
jgi:hypothetical protein